MTAKAQLAILEGLSLFGAISGLLALWVQTTPASPEDFRSLAIRVLPIVLICIFSFYYHDLYDFEVVRTLSESSSRLFQALGVSALALALVSLFFPSVVIASGLAVRPRPEMAQNVDRFSQELPFYVKHMSLRFDLRILFDTAKVVLLGRGAQ